MPDLGEEAAHGPSRRGVAGSIWVLEHAQDFVMIAVGVLLVVLAAILVVSGLVDFFRVATHSTMIHAASALLNQILLVLILLEIVHTVVLSLRAHRLAAQPFIVVGLVAVIRRILFITSGEVKVNISELGLLIAMVVAFVGGLIAISRLERRYD